jgi:hypothetical protein
VASRRLETLVSLTMIDIASACHHRQTTGSFD